MWARYLKEFRASVLSSMCTRTTLVSLSLVVIICLSLGVIVALGLSVLILAGVTLLG